ncbi:MAG: hypothetical protein PG979_000014 (plasmid) [Rickettsia asembonensis]|nr:MAG: hypothetical protein PG979_000014 [Rickettsia asembonensis]
MQDNLTVWLKEVDFPVKLLKKVFTNENGTHGTLYLITNDLSLENPRFYELYQKRWRIEEYHKSTTFISQMKVVDSLLIGMERFKYLCLFNILCSMFCNPCSNSAALINHDCFPCLIRYLIQDFLRLRNEYCSTKKHCLNKEYNLSFMLGSILPFHLQFRNRIMSSQFYKTR